MVDKHLRDLHYNPKEFRRPRSVEAPFCRMPASRLWGEVKDGIKIGLIVGVVVGVSIFVLRLALHAPR